MDQTLEYIWEVPFENGFKPEIASDFFKFDKFNYSVNFNEAGCQVVTHATREDSLIHTFFINLVSLLGGMCM